MLFRLVDRLALVLCAAVLPGCAQAARYASQFVQDGDHSRGIVFYVGGAGPVGNVGSLSVPRGFADAHYRGYVEVFPWQTVGAAVDQMNYNRNQEKAQDLADLIHRHAREYPAAPIHLVALSAGTGIAAFALAKLPDELHIQNAVFLGCSLSAEYDLTPALKHVQGRLYVFHSESDMVLGRILPYTGTIDRGDAGDGVAGLTGFRLPRHATDAMRTQYWKVRNVPYQARFEAVGYRGGHIDSTERTFVSCYLAPLLLERARGSTMLMNCPVADGSPKPGRSVARSGGGGRGRAAVE